MELQHIDIANFKNIPDASLEFSPNINCLLGNNGMGKSNLLDAIHYLSFCKSFTGINDMALIRKGEGFATLCGVYLRRDVREEISVGLMPGRRKSFKRMGKEYDRLSSHIGTFPLVLVAPADSELITGPAEERRRWMDMVISQSDPLYLDHLIRYAQALQQRNRLLRDHVVDPQLYLAIEMAMERSAAYLTAARAKWVGQLTHIFTARYRSVASADEAPSLRLLSHTAAGRPLGALLDQARRHDEMIGHTTVGPHRDDIELLLDDMPVRRTASQGQCKTYTIALRLAQFSFLEKAKGIKPLLLLDDIFDKLDSTRVERIVEMVGSEMFGQIFITDTNRDHLDHIMSRTGGDHRSWSVDRGRFTLLHPST